MRGRHAPPSAKQQPKPKSRKLSLNGIEMPIFLPLPAGEGKTEFKNGLLWAKPENL